MTDYMKKPCAKCPFRTDVKPFLTRERWEDLAYHATNPYNTFACHNTYTHDDDGNAIYDNHTKECAGFITLQANEGKTDLPDGFEPSFDLCYSNAMEMIESFIQ